MEQLSNPQNVPPGESLRQHSVIPRPDAVKRATVVTDPQAEVEAELEPEPEAEPEAEPELNGQAQTEAQTERESNRGVRSALHANADTSAPTSTMTYPHTSVSQTPPPLPILWSSSEEGSPSRMSETPPPLPQIPIFSDDESMPPALNEIEDVDMSGGNPNAPSEQQFRFLQAARSPSPILNPPASPHDTRHSLQVELEAAETEYAQVQRHSALLQEVQGRLTSTVESVLVSGPQHWDSYSRILHLRGFQFRNAWNDHEDI